MPISKETQEIRKRTRNLNESKQSAKEASEIASDLENDLDRDILGKIKSLSSPYVLLAGDEDKAKKAGCYIHCTKRSHGRFYDEGYFGNVLKPICFDLFKEINITMAYHEERFVPYTFFMWDVNIADCTETREAIECLRDLKKKMPQRFDSLVHNQISDDGLLFQLFNLTEHLLKRSSKNDVKKFMNRNVDAFELFNSGIIIHTNTKVDNIPEYFIKEFEVIPVETEKQGKAVEMSIKSETLFNWSIDNDKQEVYSNEQSVAKLSSRQFKLFNTLKRKVGKFVKKKTLETCWDDKPDYESFVTDAMNELETTLKKRLGNKENVIERKKDGKVITAYKLLP